MSEEFKYNTITSNYKETNNLPEKSVIISNPSERITPNILNRFEVASILTKRATEIENNAVYDETLIAEIEEPIEARKIAEKELEYGLIDYNIYRKVGQNTYELWNVSEMYYNE